MKSHLAYLMAVYDALLNDACRTWPQSTKFFELDKTCLRRACEHRGITFLLVTLPSLGKVLDKSLDEEIFLASEVPQGIPMIKQRPELFGVLWTKVFDECGTLREDLDIVALSFLRQLLYMAKKFKIECPTSANEESLHEFFECERGLPEPHPGTWDCDVPHWARRDGHPLWGRPSVSGGSQPILFDMADHHSLLLPWDTLHALARRVISGFGTPDWWGITPKHGPGAVSDLRGGGSKYDFPHWPRKLGKWFSYDWFGSGIFDSESHPSDREPPSRLIAVPKTYKGPRLICSEPTAHQWVQQGLSGWLEGAIKRTPLRYSIDFRSQDKSRKLALLASLDRSFCTIDLSSASDRLSCRLVEYLFQGSEILDGMHASRSRLMMQEISPKFDKFVKLRKFSTQGSALTFPVQSICFAILSAWALRLSEGREDDWENWESDFRRITVFGDDIIAPNTAFETIKLVLHECGLKVNSSKSFAKGFFRESCGIDAYRGFDVSATYLPQPYTGSPESTASLIETSNNLHKAGYWQAADVVIGFLPVSERKLLAVKGPNSGGQGLFSYVGSSFAHLKRRWNKNLQKEEYRVLGTTSKVPRALGTDLARLSQYFFEDPSKYYKYEPGTPWRAEVRKTSAWVSE